MTTHRGRLFIVTGQLPLEFAEQNSRVAALPSMGNIATAISAFLGQRSPQDPPAFSGIGWTGTALCKLNDWESLQYSLPAANYTCHPVFLPAKYQQTLLKGLASKVPWPLFQESPSQAAFSSSDYEDYFDMNLQFADSMQKYLRASDTVWIQDHQLLPLAGMLRQRFPELTIGLFLHTSFPSFEIFRHLPGLWQEQILRGMLGAELIGFQTNEYAALFRKCAQLTLNAGGDDETIEYDNRLIRTGSFPVGNEYAGWGKSFLLTLDSARTRQIEYQARFFDPYSYRHLLESYRNARKRQFILDYDGTLMPFFTQPSQAKPADMVLETLSRLAGDSRNSVCIISGRDGAILDAWLGHLPLHLVAEHGAQVRYRGSAWEKIALPAEEWKDQVIAVMDRYSQLCPGAFVEKKNFSIVWHYRNADQQSADKVKIDLHSALSEATSGLPLQVTIGKKIVEVRNNSIHKGSAVRNLLEHEASDFILAIGDDRTDEDMFRALADKKHAFTLKVGPEASHALFNVPTPQSVISLLSTLGNL